ncbi:MAG: phosphotransferase [Halobacterium sp.]
MTGRVHDRLAGPFDDYQVNRQLHDVPPHEVYEVAVDGRRAVYKGDTGPTGSAATEGRVTRFVDEHTTVPVPEVLAVGDDWFLAAWHPDAPAPDTDHPGSEDWAEPAGRALARLHDESARHLDGFGRLQFDSDVVPRAGRGDWQAAALAFVERRRNLLAAHGHADVADAVCDCFRDHPGLFADAGRPVLCHGWWSPEHVAVRGGEAACAVDFEHALAAPRAFDYWRTALAVFDGGDAEAAFREGYESVSALTPRVEERRPVYVALHCVYFFESLYVQNQRDAAATAEQADYLRERAFDALDDCRRLARA